jgi:hypothetical protein
VALIDNVSAFDEADNEEMEYEESLRSCRTTTTVPGRSSGGTLLVIFSSNTLDRAHCRYYYYHKHVRRPCLELASYLEDLHHRMIARCQAMIDANNGHIGYYFGNSPSLAVSVACISISGYIRQTIIRFTPHQKF